MMRDRDWPRYGEMRDGLKGWVMFFRDKTRAFPLTALLMAFALGMLVACSPAKAGIYEGRKLDAISELLRWQICATRKAGARSGGISHKWHAPTQKRFECHKLLDEDLQ